jgi:hypothetical protein
MNPGAEGSNVAAHIDLQRRNGSASAPPTRETMNRFHALSLVALLSISLSPTLANASGERVVVDATSGPYGEPCAGAYFEEATEANRIVVVCAGKGVITDDPKDCVVHVAAKSSKICL